MPSRFIPSTLLPGFLQNEFKVGSENPNPLLTSIDESFSNFRNRLFGKFFPYHRDFFRTPEKKAHLERMGFKTQTLSPNEIVIFYENLDTVLKNIEKIDAVYFLSQLYFFGSEVERGRNLSVMQLTRQKLNFQIPEKNHKNQVLIIKLPGHLPTFDSKRVEELVSNCQEIIPPSFRLLVRGNLKKRADKQLSFPFQIPSKKFSFIPEGACHISLN